MNIFTVSGDVNECATALDDRRLIKMILETAQMLSTAIHFHVPELSTKVYKKTHMSHPCALWVRSNKSNYQWTLDLFDAYVKEYQLRFGKIHKSYGLFDVFKDAIQSIPTGTLTDQPKCFIENVSRTLSVYEGYKETLKIKWLNDKNPKWTKRSRPF